MEYFRQNILRHVTSYHFPIFCGAMFVGHYFGKKLLNKYNEKYKINSNVNNTRYFMMHFVFNICSVACTYRNMIDTINNPLVIKKESNAISFYNVLFHLYHSAFYWKSMELDEQLHHIFSVFLLCPLTWLNYTNLCNSTSFYIIGLPGAATYLLLSLKDMGFVESMTEKRISKHLNMLVRMPGAILNSYIIYLNYINGSFGQTTPVINFGIYLSIGAIFWNGIHFANTITESYAIHKYKRESPSASSRSEPSVLRTAAH
jgi:hypothetical protein